MTKWVPQTFTTEDRLRVVDQILDVLKGRYKESLIAVAIEGSTAKGLDAPESDLELRVLLDTNSDYHRWYAFFFEGMFVGISYNSYERTLKKSKVIDYEWPVSGDGFKSAKVIYDPDDVYDVLKANDDQAVQDADFRELIIEAMTDLYEHIYKVFTLSSKNDIGIVQEISAITYWSAITVGLTNQHSYPSNKHMVEESFTLNLKPERYEEHIRALFLNHNLDEIKLAVGDLWQSFVNWAHREYDIDLNDDGLLMV